ncbi:MAG: hypothetical protein WC451_00600 [Patescibacteria group bacterium]
MEGEEKSEQIVLPVKKKKNLTWLWIVITAVVVGGGVSAYAYRGTIKDKFWPAKEEEKKADESAATTSSDGSVTSTKIKDEGIAWIAPREKLADLGLFKKGSGSTDDAFPGYVSTTYYKVATTTSGDEIIFAMAEVETMGTYYDFHHFLKKGGVYYFLPENSDAVGGDGNYYSRTNSESDATFVIKSLQLDKTITIGTTKLTLSATSSREKSFADATTAGSKLGETKWGDLYLLKGSDIELSAGDAKVAQYYVLRNDGARIIYSPTPTYRNDDGTFSVTWSNALGASYKYSQIKTSGCGGGGGSFPLIIDQTALSTKTEVASASGKKIYTVDAASPLANFAYAVYKMDEMGSKVTQAAMMADLGVLVLQDGYDNWTIYMNDKYAPAVECGKPVIYLYPEKNTEVSVKVGADIRISEPAYNGGWKVSASPSGKLTLGGQIYDSLYWEGTGWGKYPAVTSGTVVETFRVAEVITNQLKYMGLNNKEIADFKEFWLPKMPASPFVRLTWFGTEEMDELAPIAVSPKPDSSIRVFLDFQGLDSKETITSQILPKYQRVGFTLVEWGGLLRSKK